MFERFTDRARRVLVQAQQEAKLLEHNFIGTEHILLGLLADGEDCPEEIAATALATFGITLPAARQKVAEALEPMSSVSATGSPPFTPRTKKVLELSLREALQLSHQYIGTEHLLLGLVREGEGMGAQVIVTLGAELGAVRQKTLELIEAREPNVALSASELLLGTGRPIGRRATSPRCRCGADVAVAARYRNIEAEAATGEADRGPVVTTVVYCQDCGLVLGLSGPFAGA
jgi:ATP-dependent Clp protease ATP-binding subunit ClpA